MIEIKNLDFSYGKNKLFNDLNLNIENGKIYGLLGRNGAGKTSLLKIIAGLIFPDNGICKVLDYETKKRYTEMLKEIYFIPESYFLPNSTIQQYERLISPFYPSFDKDNFYQKVKDFELELNKSLKNFSYGQKKKFLLAFGIASQCKILIFDEPTNGLDIPSQRLVRKHLSECINENRTIIISTHHVKEMENIFDIIVVLDNGKIIFNKDLQSISEKIILKVVQSFEGLQNIVYSEEMPGGFSILQKNIDGNEGRIDIEFLFNAILNQNEKINSLF